MDWAGEALLVNDRTVIIGRTGVVVSIVSETVDETDQSCVLGQTCACKLSKRGLFSDGKATKSDMRS